ncbi:preprotein translocase subunit SecD [Mycobacterium sp. 852002-10029_SCH5224772]|uniref:SecDF P1 head subdomain-containing protein n=1 Tax=Mycobacterium sp. 852002-10029_SCH5224772 TaxID=1834083 RepID=UPI0007FF087F|nr:preprotein translocase subunit SecD [Mycobacterium sp. 852002-10029_SCH5224772]OBF06315.1 preprotein translocase subunit SecD [Mycobacterium sp. 852002-10029_SCH5224772]
MSPRRVRVSNAVAWLGSIGLLAALMCGCHAAHKPAPSSPPTTKAPSTSAAPAAPPPIIKIAPLPVRPVTKSHPTTPATTCPEMGPNVPVAPTDVLDTCDLGRANVYTLGPETLQLGLIHVEPPKALTADFYEVTLVLDSPSADAWATFTAAHMKDHVAFTRDNLVLEAPIIEQQVTSGRIVLTTQTAERAAQLAQLAGHPA